MKCYALFVGLQRPNQDAYWQYVGLAKSDVEVGSFVRGIEVDIKHFRTKLEPSELMTVSYKVVELPLPIEPITT